MGKKKIYNSPIQFEFDFEELDIKRNVKVIEKYVDEYFEKVKTPDELLDWTDRIPDEFKDAVLFSLGLRVMKMFNPNA